MTKQSGTAALDAELRRRAEELLQRDHPPDQGEAARSPADSDIQRLLHELQVHQIALELQNAELMEARTQAEETLTRYTDLYDFAPVGYFTLGPAGEILQTNLTGARMLGQPRSQVTGRRFATFVAASSIPAFNAYLEQLCLGSRTGPADVTLDIAADTPKVVRLEAVASEDRQTCRAMVSDVTERTRIEAAIQRQRMEMERLMNLQIASQTVAALAHELNQPLAAVSAYAETALRLLRVGNPTPDKLQHALEQSALQAQRAGGVARNMLTVLHKGEVDIGIVDLNHVVCNAVTIARANDHGDFHTRLELAPDLAPVTANQLQVEKVLVNLIQNGIEAMRDAGVNPSFLTIAARTAADGRMAHVTVSDSGPGLDEQTLHRVFDPFFTTKASGLGMGLPISRTIIESHGGQLWVESDPSMGASFHFTLPFAQ